MHIQLQVYRRQIKSNMTINVSCVTPLICVTFKTTLQRNSQEGRFCHRTVLFPVIRQSCSADVKMLVFLSLLPHEQKTEQQSPHLIYIYKTRTISAV